MRTRRIERLRLWQSLDAMPERYRSWTAAWIHGHWDRRHGMRHQCYRAANDMVRAFPELRRIEGLGFTVGHLARTCRVHAWCELPDGRIVDPTAMQFAAPVGYARYPAELGLPFRKCPECRKTLFDRLDRPDCCAMSIEDYQRRVFAAADPNLLPRRLRRLLATPEPACPST